MTSYQYLWGCSNTHRNRKSDIYVNSKENLFQFKVNLEGVPGARMKMMSLHVTQEHWGATITSMYVCIPISSKDPQGIPACLESDPPFLEWVQTVVQWHLREISRTAGFLVRLAGFKWKLSVSAKWWPDTRTDFPISGMPHLMAGCVCMCMLHLHALTSEGCGDALAGSLLSQVNQKGVRQSPPCQASRSRLKFPTAENHCVAGFT